jgi:phosphoenolpyruvate---glycerone phosphotransferase subunit DhaK
MKKIMNAPKNFVTDMIEGILAAHPTQLKTANHDPRCLVRAGRKKAGKVGLATGGGSGHLPVFLGYVGEGMLDGVSIGNVFASPSANQMLEVTKEIDAGAGVLYIYGNYGGDIMNFDMAAELAQMDGIRVEQILVADDVASAPKGQEQKRRGVAGLFLAYKIAGASANEMSDLDTVKAVTEKALANTRTMGIALSPCIVPEAGKATFTLGEDEMEIGMGIHGEPGIVRGKMQTADDMTETIVTKILEDLPFSRGDEVTVLINGLGATPLEELYIVFRKVNGMLTQRHINIHHPYIGEYATSMEMAGMSITLMKLDSELKRLLDAPANTPFFKQCV